MDGYVVIGTELDTKSFDAQIDYVESQLQEIEHKLKQADMGFEVGDTMKLEAQYEKLSQKLSTLKQKKESLNKTDLSNVQKSIENIGKSTSNTIKQVGRWVLGIFAIESAYGFVRQAITSVSSYNEQIKTDVEYIKFALASSLQPVIEGLIQLAYKLLTYVNYIAQAWFGVNLFANASAKAMEKGSKSADKMKKSLAGFDEMNIMQDTTSGGAGGGATAPSIDLSQWQGEIPSWIQWIADNKDIVIAGLLGIAGGLTAVSFGLTAIQGLGIGVAIVGIVLLIQDIIDMINDPSWENFIAILGDIAIAVGGLMLLFGNWWGLLIAGIGLIVKLVAENWDKIWAIIEPIAQTIYNNVLVPIGTFVMATTDTIVSIIKLAISIIAGIFTTVVNIIANPFIVAKEIIIGVFNNIKSATTNIVNGIKKLFSGDLKGALNDFKNAFSNVFGALWTIAKAPLNLIIGGINSLIKGANKISFDVPDWVPGIGGKKWGFNIKQIPKLAVGGIVNMPGRGVPVGGAITGEAGREGVIPLTDSQAMETLGATIGKYININLTNITKLDNRQIAKEQKKINAQSDFAFNR